MILKSNTIYDKGKIWATFANKEDATECYKYFTSKDAKTQEEDILFKAIETALSISKNDMLSKRKYKDLIDAIRLFIHLLPYRSTTDVGKILNRDHSTIVYHRRILNGILQYDKELQLKLAAVKMEIKNLTER